MTEPRIAPAVEFATAPVVTIDDATIARIRQMAQASPQKRARICLHQSTDELLHNMLIVLLRGTVVAPHRHSRKAECYHVLAGEMTLVLLNDDRTTLERIKLGAFGSGRSPMCRIAPGIWHTVEVETDEVIMHESTVGPLMSTDTEYLPDAAS